MSIYPIINVPVMNDRRKLIVKVDTLGNIRVINAPSDCIEDLHNSWRVCDIYVGDHMFEAKNQQLLREMYGQDVVSALEKGIQLGYAKAQQDIRKALGI